MGAAVGDQVDCCDATEGQGQQLATSMRAGTSGNASAVEHKAIQQNTLLFNKCEDANFALQRRLNKRVVCESHCYMGGLKQCTCRQVAASLYGGSMRATAQRAQGMPSTHDWMAFTMGQGALFNPGHHKTLNAKTKSACNALITLHNAQAGSSHTGGLQATQAAHMQCTTIMQPGNVHASKVTTAKAAQQLFWACTERRMASCT